MLLEVRPQSQKTGPPGKKLNYCFLKADFLNHIATRPAPSPQNNVELTGKDFSEGPDALVSPSTLFWGEGRGGRSNIVIQKTVVKFLAGLQVP